MVKVGQSYLAIAVSAARAKNHGNKKGEAASGKSTDSKTALRSSALCPVPCWGVCYLFLITVVYVISSILPHLFPGFMSPLHADGSQVFIKLNPFSHTSESLIQNLLPLAVFFGFAQFTNLEQGSS